MKRGYWILLGIVLLAVIQSVYYYPKVPDIVASHFGPGGHPNGWMTKPIFFVTYLGMLASGDDVMTTSKMYWCIINIRSILFASRPKPFVLLPSLIKRR